MLNAAASGLSSLPATARPFAATQALYRFLANDAVTLPALIEPIRETARPILARSSVPVALIVHDWSMLHYGGHASKRDRLQRTHETDLGDELGSALLIEADRGVPLGPMEIRLRVAFGVHSTRVGGASAPSSRIDELFDVMEASKTWGLDRPPVHIVDREADSVGHYREWDAAGHRFLVRADAARIVRWNGRSLALRAVSACFDAATLVQWYDWRWRIESYHKLLKSSGQQVEEWEQESAEPIAKRLVIASMACTTVWALQGDDSADAATLRKLLVRLSGRQMKWGVESTTPALMAGLEKLLAMLDVLDHYDLDELRSLVHRSLPNLFNSS